MSFPRNRKLLIVGGAGLALALGGAGFAIAGGGGDDDGTEQPVTGNALDRASAVALDETGGGKVTESEVGDEEGYYEIGVTLDDGSQVDVHLDRNFNVIDSSADGSGEDEGAGDDGSG